MNKVPNNLLGVSLNFLNTSLQAGTMVVLIRQMKKLRHTEVHTPLQDHRVDD